MKRMRSSDQNEAEVLRSPANLCTRKRMRSSNEVLRSPAKIGRYILLCTCKYKRLICFAYPSEELLASNEEK